MVATKRCAWGTCKNDSRYPERMVENCNADLISFIHFPGSKRSAEKRKRWIDACRRGDSFVCSKDSYICSLHFVGENGPTVEHPDPIPATASKEFVQRMNRKRKPPTQRSLTKRPRLVDEKSAANALLLLSYPPSGAGRSEEEMSVAHILSSFIDNAGTKQPCETTIFSENQDGQDETQQGFECINVDINQENNNKATQTSLDLHDINAYDDCMLQNRDNLHRHLFLARVEVPNRTMHYTGMCKECLEAVFDLIKHKASRVHAWKGTRKTRVVPIHNKYLKQKYSLTKLNPREQFIFTLIRLRRNTSIVMLSDIFGISPTTGSRIFITWVLFLSKELMFLLPFSTINDLDAIKKPKELENIEILRAIIDCTEFYIQKPTKVSSQRSTHSQYKSSNTFKLLVSISPIAHFNFISRLFTGSISDKEIVKESDFLEQLEPGDVVMADKGFNIQDLLALRETRLMAPPLMRRGNISSGLSTATRRIAKVRVHVERMIRKLKCFTILKGVIPLTVKPYVDSVVTICAALVNLQPSVIQDSEYRDD